MGETGHVFAVGAHMSLSSSTPSHSLLKNKQHQKPHPIPFSDWSGCNSGSWNMDIMDTHLCVQHAPPPGLLLHSWLQLLAPGGSEPHSSHKFRAKCSWGNSPWAKPELQAGEFRGRMLNWCLGPHRATRVAGYSSLYKGKVNSAIYLNIIKNPKHWKWCFGSDRVCPAMYHYLEQFHF